MVWKVVHNHQFASKVFLSHQILLLEEQNHKDSRSLLVVPDTLEEIRRPPTCIADGSHDDDGSPIIEATDSFAVFIQLAVPIESIEVSCAP